MRVVGGRWDCNGLLIQWRPGWHRFNSPKPHDYLLAQQTRDGRNLSPPSLGWRPLKDSCASTEGPPGHMWDFRWEGKGEEEEEILGQPFWVCCGLALPRREFWVWRSAGGNTNQRHRVLPLFGSVLDWRDGFVSISVSVPAPLPCVLFVLVVIWVAQRLCRREC